MRRPNKRLCVVDGCSKPQHARGWCLTHYEQWRRNSTDLRGPLPAVLRFWSSVQEEPGDNGCWIWMAGKVKGYALFHMGKQHVLGHRWAWEQENGPIPDGVELDHLCRVPACVRPSHLEPVTHQENVIRGIGPSAVNARKTHCRNGHPYDVVTSRGYRECSLCQAARWRRRDRRSA